ncbi:hypothetical protein MKX03_005843, partial [Papaver bracteatum]
MASSSNQSPLPLFEDANEVPANWSLVHESHFIELMLDKVRICDHKKLVEDNTGLGWDPVLCTLDASNEWWDVQVK